MISLKKLKIFGAGALILMLAAIPAMANTYNYEQEAESGDVVQVYETGSVYGNGNAVANNAEFNANTGNYQNQEAWYYTGNVQYDNGHYSY